MRISLETLGTLADLKDSAAQTLLTWFENGGIKREDIGTKGGDLTLKAPQPGGYNNTFYFTIDE